MPKHKYRIGQAVQFQPGHGVDYSAKGRYTIVRLLPVEANMPQYRVKNASNGQERLVREHELEVR